jgi:dipeptidyl-peptidase-3
MKRITTRIALGAMLIATIAGAANPKKTPRNAKAAAKTAAKAAEAKPASSLVERVGSTGFIQVEAGSFKDLDARQKQLVYWLSQAAIAIDPIIYDQLSRFGVRQKVILELIAAHPAGIDKAVMAKIDPYTKLFWANHGNHQDSTAQKFLPDFTPAELEAATLKAFANTPGAPLTEAWLKKELAELQPAFFDPNFEPQMTAKNPRGGLDIIQASSNNFYAPGVTLKDLEGFKETHPLNSRVSKNADGSLSEEVYRAGTPDGSVKPGRYPIVLGKAIGFLQKAREFAEPGQAPVIDALIRYYQTGDPNDWLDFGRKWVRNSPKVDFANGFIEVYRDARGAKGTSQAFVSITDERLNALMAKVAANAQYFENHAPWAEQYKKQGVQPPLAKAVETTTENGDFAVTIVGDNLPNENEIRESVGTKSFLFSGSSRALERARGPRATGEFVFDDAEKAIVEKHAEEASDLMTALHEVIGHGSGKVNPKLTNDPATYLKEYYSTLEEARADLMALWNIWDPKLQELGVVSHPDVAKAMYYSAARAPLVQLRSIPRGETIEEDHQRDRQMIVEYIMDKVPGSIERVQKNGKTYMHVIDFAKMREGVGMLLAELMRIKGEGDYAAIKALIDRYGVHFDPKVRDEVVARYKQLDLPTYWSGINAEVKADGTISYPRDVRKQRVSYGAMYHPELLR